MTNATFKNSMSPKLDVPRLRFIGEQDGSPERELKERLIHLFKTEPNIMAAYLANVVHDNESSANVALCLQTRSVGNLEQVKKIGKIFASMFNPREHLDIIFLDHEQMVDVARVCAPFYCGVDTLNFS